MAPPWFIIAAARRATARLPASATAPEQPQATAEITPQTTPQEVADEDDARVPCVIEDEAWKTEFLR